MLDSGDMMLSCQRSADVSDEDVQGLDGVTYHVISRKSGHCCFVQKADKSVGKRVQIKKELVEVDHVELLNDTKLDQINRAIMGMLVLEDFHRDYLHKEGWTDEMIQKAGIKSFPGNDFAVFKKYCPYPVTNMTRRQVCKRIMEKFNLNSLRGYPGAYLKKGKQGDYWTLAGRSGICFPMYNIHGKMYQLRIRMDYLDAHPYELDQQGRVFFFNDKDGLKIYVDYSGPYMLSADKKVAFENRDEGFKGKYRSLSSYKLDQEELKAGRLVNIYQHGSTKGNSYSLYSEKGDDLSICLLIEGEKKGKYVNFKTKLPTGTIPGVNSYQLLFQENINGDSFVKHMVKRGTKLFIICFDADKISNESVKRYEESLSENMRNYIVENDLPCDVAIADWDIEIGKGLDDFLRRKTLADVKCTIL